MTRRSSDRPPATVEHARDDGGAILVHKDVTQEQLGDALVKGLKPGDRVQPAAPRRRRPWWALPRR